MLGTQLPFAELHRTLLEYDGNDAYGHVLNKWFSYNADQCDWIADFQRRTNDDWNTATDDDLAQLYAIFRVTSVLLLRFQTRIVDSGYDGPAISHSDFCRFHERLGFQVRSETQYHPFFHEILSVRQSANDDDPISVAKCAWPCLMLGDLMFCRSGCSVVAGCNSARKSVVERSTLYWTYRRNDRPCNDLSHGWGHNSQWRTAHRRDYLAHQRFHYNVDGNVSLNDANAETDELPRQTCIDLVRDRCLLNASIDDDDLWPYDYSYTENAEP
ncbi:hypothetical protein [Rhodopirellula baltica]|uniref:Uncharacterized protein n=1 Tax=Rhodopirellula baltica SWK14 TaxID=993516 RepID=L7CB41_RHOBT|nr:hypothetical protein RBSWK_04635 [Rhodopirellula baltica SWK14]